MKRNWIGPLLGVIFVALFVAISIILGEGQDATEKSAEELVEFYSDNETERFIAAALIGLASITILFFAGYFRRVLRDAEGPNGILSAVALAGAIVFAAGATVAASIQLAMADLADEELIDPVVIQTLNAIDWDFFLFFPVGLGTFLLASGISVIRHAALPKWLGWVAIVIVILFFTPAFFVGFYGAPLWILVVSILLLLRTRNEPSGAPPAA